MWILKDLECTEIVQRNHILRILRARPREGGSTPYFLQRVRIYLIPKNLRNPVMQKSAQAHQEKRVKANWGKLGSGLRMTGTSTVT